MTNLQLRFEKTTEKFADFRVVADAHDGGNICIATLVREGVGPRKDSLTLIRTDDDQGTLRRIDAQKFISMSVALIIALVIVKDFVQV